MASDLQVTTSPRPNSRLALEVVVPAEHSRQSYDAALNKLCRTTRLPGFRQGKVPRAMLLQRLGSKHVCAAALQTLLETTLRNTLARDDLRLLGQPELKQEFEALVEQFKPDEAITLSFESDVEPVPALDTYTGLTVPAKEVDPDPEWVDKAMALHRRSMATVVPVDGRAAVATDIAVINARGHFTDDNTAVPGGSFEEKQLELDDDSFLPGFTKGIVGMTIGSSTSVTVTFPVNTTAERQGREAVFEVELLGLKERELPDLNDDFAARVSGEESLAAWRSSLEKQQAEREKQQTSQRRQEALMKVLIEKLEVEIPAVMLRDEERLLLQESALELSQRGVDVEKLFTGERIKELRPVIQSQAVEQLKYKLVLQLVAEEQSIQADESAVEAEMGRQLDRFREKKQKADRAKLRRLITENLLEDKALAWLEEHNTFVAAARPEAERSDTVADIVASDPEEPIH